MTDDDRRLRALLDEVAVPAPPPDFAARVVAAHRGRRPRYGFIAAAAVLVVASALGARALLGGASSRGAVVVSADRVSVDVAHRGVAVAEAGAALAWSVDARGHAAVEQTAGNVFYRVEPGGAFVVRTGAGEVRVTGTCFRVEVSAVKSSTQSIVSGAAGALVAVVATVTVYEGRVIAASPDGRARPVEAGERAQLAPDGVRPLATAGAAVAAKAAVTAPPGASAAATSPSRAPLPGDLTAEQLYVEHARVAREADTLRSRVDELEQKLAKVSRRQRTYGLDQEELRAMADRCELRWDTVPLGDDEVGLDVKSAERLSLSEEERAAVTRLMRASQKKLSDSVSALYTELTGDPNVGSLTASAMIDEIIDKTPPPDRQAIFQRLAQERAGLISPAVASPGAPPASPFERLFRSLTTSGDALEGDLAQELGPDTARRIRDLHDGWGDKSRSSRGCPGGGE